MYPVLSGFLPWPACCSVDTWQRLECRLHLSLGCSWGEPRGVANLTVAALASVGLTKGTCNPPGSRKAKSK